MKQSFSQNGAVGTQTPRSDTGRPDTPGPGTPGKDVGGTVSERVITGRVTRIGAQGDGLIEGSEPPVYLPFVLPGEDVRVRVDGATVLGVERLADSMERVQPACRLFGSCGGCQLQHWQEQGQREWKRARVVELLGRAGLLGEPAPVVVEPARPAHGAGRRRASLHLRNKPGEGVRLGFKARGRHEVIDMTECPVLHPRLAAAVPALKAFASPLLGRSSHAKAGCDLMLTLTDDGLDVDVRGLEKGLSVLGPARRTELAELATRLDLARLSVQGSVVAQARSPSLMMGRARVGLPPGPFLQATAEAESLLASLVCEGLAGARRVADLFCGLGPFALRLADACPVVGYDSERAAIAALRKAADQTQGLKPIDAQHRDLFRQPLGAQELKAFDAVVLDPPRAGAEAQCLQLASDEVRKLKGLTRLAYVSCAPDAFARDAALLVAGGWRLERIVPVDQFRWSSHIELVAQFRR